MIVWSAKRREPAHDASASDRSGLGPAVPPPVDRDALALSGVAVFVVAIHFVECLLLFSIADKGMLRGFPLGGIAAAILFFGVMLTLSRSQSGWKFRRRIATILVLTLVALLAGKLRFGNYLLLWAAWLDVTAVAVLRFLHGGTLATVDSSKLFVTARQKQTGISQILLATTLVAVAAVITRTLLADASSDESLRLFVFLAMHVTGSLFLCLVLLRLHISFFILALAVLVAQCIATALLLEGSLISGETVLLLAFSASFFTHGVLFLGMLRSQGTRWLIGVRSAMTVPPPMPRPGFAESRSDANE
ncbi:MAG: hypothetical protein AAF958_08290 [Planctomycetota bacterium]